MIMTPNWSIVSQAKTKILFETPQSVHITKFDKELARSSSKKLFRGSIKDVHLTPLDQEDHHFVFK